MTINWASESTQLAINNQQIIDTVKDVIKRHTTRKTVNMIEYSVRFIDSHLFTDSQIANFLAEDVTDDSFDPILAAMSDVLPKNTTQPVCVLNIGSGEGVLTKLVKNHFGDDLYVIDIDLSSEMLRYSIADKQVLADVLEMPFEDSSVDIAISHCTIRYIQHNNYNKFIQQTMRILKPKGVAIVAETNQQVASEFIRQIQNSSIQFTVKDKVVRMFRCSRFYCLYEEYRTEDKFKRVIDDEAICHHIVPIELLGYFAGFKRDLVRIVMYGLDVK